MMKKRSLLSVLLLTIAANVYANQTEVVNENQSKTPQIANVAQADKDVNNALRLKFISRRAAQNPAVETKGERKVEDEWVGASHVEAQESEASKRLNRQFRSKRPHINYQFD